MICQSRRFKFWDVISTLLLLVGLSQSLGVAETSSGRGKRARKGDLSAVLTLTNDLSCRGLCRWVSLGHSETNRVALDTLSLFLSKNNLEMGGFGHVQEVLRIAAPELVLAAVIKGASTTSSHSVPFGCERLLDSAGKLNEVNWLRTEESEEERSLVTLSDGISLDVGDNNVMDRLVVVGWVEPEGASDFSLLEALETLGSLILDVVSVHFPKSVTLRLNSHDEEVNGNVSLLAQSKILLHQTDDDLSLFGHSEAVLRVVEPLIVGVEVDLGVLGLFITISEGRVGTTVSDALPLSMNGVLRPGAREDLADIDLVVVSLPVLVVHPPVSIVLETISEIVTKLKLIIPSLIFVTEATIPFTGSRSPRVPDVDELKLVSGTNVFSFEKSVGVIESDSIGACALFLLSILGFLRVCATNEVPILKVHLHLLPENSILEKLASLRGLQVEFLRDTA